MPSPTPAPAVVTTSETTHSTEVQVAAAADAAITNPATTVSADTAAPASTTTKPNPFQALKQTKDIFSDIQSAQNIDQIAVCLSKIVHDIDKYKFNTNVQLANLSGDLAEKDSENKALLKMNEKLSSENKDLLKMIEKLSDRISTLEFNAATPGLHGQGQTMAISLSTGASTQNNHASKHTVSTTPQTLSFAPSAFTPLTSGAPAQTQMPKASQKQQTNGALALTPANTASAPAQANGASVVQKTAQNMQSQPPAVLPKVPLQPNVAPALPPANNSQNQASALSIKGVPNLDHIYIGNVCPTFKADAVKDFIHNHTSIDKRNIKIQELTKNHLRPYSRAFKVSVPKGKTKCIHQPAVGQFNKGAAL